VRTLRTLGLCLLFVAAVFISSANVHVVELVYLPGIGIESTWEPRAVHVPLFVVVLASLIIGALLGGAGALFEQARLRLALRKARKVADKAASDADEARQAEAARAEDALRLGRELDRARAAAPAPPIAQTRPTDEP